MAFKLAEAFVELSARGSAGVMRAVDQIHTKLRGLGRAVTAGLTGGFSGAALQKFFAIAAQGMHEYMEAQEASARLEGILKATGNAALFTAEELRGVAAALQKVTTFDDDAIVGMQALLATFTNVRGDVFLRAKDAILDIATAMDRDLSGAAMAVGQALHNPIEGLQQLSRMGVRFTATQEKQIANWIKSGDIIKAQELILARVEARFKGVAKAVAATDAGKVLKLRNELGDLREELGKEWLPVEISLVKLQRALMPLFKEAAKWISQAAELLADFDWASVFEGLKALWESVVLFISGSLAKIAGQIEAIIAMIRGVGLALGDPLNFKQHLQDADTAMAVAKMSGNVDLLRAGLAFQRAVDNFKGALPSLKEIEDRKKANALADANKDNALKESQLRGRKGNRPFDMPEVKGKPFEFKFLDLEEAIKDLQSSLSGDAEARRHADLIRKHDEANKHAQDAVGVLKKIEKKVGTARFDR